MSEVKTIDELIKEKQSLSDHFSETIDSFLRDNPQVLDVQITSSTFSFTVTCGEVKEVSVHIKLIM